MSSRTSMLHVRVDDDTKTLAATALSAMGLSISDAVRMFLHRVVVDQALPLELKVPNSETRKAMAEADEIASRRSARFDTAADALAELEKASAR